MRENHTSGVFMMEMITVVFFFILCSGICIRTFAQAELFSRRAVELNQSVSFAQSVAEVWKAEGEAGLKRRFEAVCQTDSQIWEMQFYESQALDKKAGEPYCVAVDLSQALKAEITVSRRGRTIFSLSAAGHEKEQ